MRSIAEHVAHIGPFPPTDSPLQAYVGSLAALLDVQHDGFAQLMNKVTALALAAHVTEDAKLGSAAATLVMDWYVLEHVR